jgi:multiple sugar transport system substrate-binding protein
MVYWARQDLLDNPDEQAAFKVRYGYPLAAAQTMQQLLDNAEFFTRKTGETLAGATLSEDFYGIVLEGIAGGTMMPGVWQNLLLNWGGGLLDADGKPAFDTPENIAALTFWAQLWKFSPPGQAEYSLIDVPTVMGNGIAAQSIAWSDFVLGIDKPGASPYAGKFTYGGIPVNSDYAGPRSASAEPSLVVISQSSANAQATYLFMQWLIDKDTQRKLIEAGAGGVPLRYSSLQLAPMQTPEMASLVAAMSNTLEVAVAKPKLPKFFEIYDALTPLIQEVGLGTLSPEDAVKQGQQKLLDICSKCTL